MSAVPSHELGPGSNEIKGEREKLTSTASFLPLPSLLAAVIHHNVFISCKQTRKCGSLGPGSIVVSPDTLEQVTAGE